eukprot:6207288-Pleurochrysis_carterae.AAC.2
MLYALFDGLQAVWTEDTIYFFMDFTVKHAPRTAHVPQGFWCGVCVWCVFGGGSWKQASSSTGRTCTLERLRPPGGAQAIEKRDRRAGGGAELN